MDTFFYSWVPSFLRLPILYLLLFTTLVCNGIFPGNTIYMYSSLGVYAETFTQANNSVFIGMGLGFLILGRLRIRFDGKTLFITGLSGMLVTNLICATSPDPVLINAACLILGFAKIIAVIDIYGVWVHIWSKEGNISRFFPFFYLNILAGVGIITWLTTKLAYIYNWQYSYIIILLSLFICLVLVIILVEKHPLEKKISLYHLDITGLILIATSLMLLNYAVVYGQTEDWFNSPKIETAFFLSALSFLWFIKREISIKRPLFNFRLFKSKSYRVGLLYLLLLGVFLPVNFQSVLTLGTLHYISLTNSEVNLFMIPGMVAGSAFCWVWYFKNYDEEWLVIIGFSLFVIYYILMYNYFGTQFSISDFWLPSLFKGFAAAMLYISLALFATRGMEFKYIFPGIGGIIIVRSFLGNSIFTSIYNYLLYSHSVRHFTYLAELNNSQQQLSNGLKGTELYSVFQQQATLAAAKEITGYIIFLGLALLIFLLAKLLYRKLTTASVG